MPLSKGQTNNPKGRPKKNNSLTLLLAKYGNKKIDIPEDKRDDPQFKDMHGMKLKDALAKNLWQLAVFNKDITSIKYIFDRIDGKPINTVVTGNDIKDLGILKAIQKELFNEEELGGIQDEGTMEPPEEAGAGVGE